MCTDRKEGHKGDPQNQPIFQYFWPAFTAGLRVLVNNVGGTIWIQPYHHYTEEQVRHEIDRSLYPTMWCCLAVLPIMLAVMVSLAPQTRLYRSFFLDEIGRMVGGWTKANRAAQV